MQSDVTENLWEEMDVPIVDNRVPLSFISWYVDHTLHMGFDFSADTHVHVKFIRKDAVKPPVYFRGTSIAEDDVQALLKKLKRKNKVDA